MHILQPMIDMGCNYYQSYLLILYHVKVVLWYLGISLSPEDYVDSRSAMPPDLEKPDCAQVFDLPYSIHAFQHLRVSKEQTW